MTHRPAVMVLGASRGLGRATAIALGRAGFVVGVACRNIADAKVVVTNMSDDGSEAIALEVDVTRLDMVEAAFDTLSAQSASLAGVINNAGAIVPIARIGDASAEQWARTVHINLIGAFHGAHAALPRLGRGGVVVNLSSKAAELPMEGWSAYCASKAGLAMLTRSVAHEYGEAGILSFGLRPGLVDTDMQVTIRSSAMNPISQIPQADLVPPEKPARFIEWLFRARPVDLSGLELDIRDEALAARVDAEMQTISARTLA